MVYSEAEKLKFVRGFKKCTLPIWQYAEKMQLDENDLKDWLKEYKHIPAFGAIQIDNTVAPKSSTKNTTEEEQKEVTTTVAEKTTEVTTGRTILSFENETIKIEIKQNYNKELLKSLIGVVEQC